MDAQKIGTRREVCWDEFLFDQAVGIRVQMHKPEFRGVAFTCDAPWEGNTSGYFTIIPDEGHYRLYYRGSNLTLDSGGKQEQNHETVFCYAESRDGLQFKRIPVGDVPFWGSKDNNIIMDMIRDNIYFFKDTNPACPPEERYKGLAEYQGQALHLFTSADGMHFKYNRLVADDGAYDSLNVAFWDPTTEQYFLFYRGMHGAYSKNGKWSDEIKDEAHDMHNKNVVRDVRVKTSKDFVNWSEGKMLDFGPDADDYELYTNTVQKYYRAKHMFVGFPARYIDRYTDAQNYPYLPDWKNRQGMIRLWGRSGTAMTDGIIMTSRDGYHFRRTDEVFLGQGIENGRNWYYGERDYCYGLIETPSQIPGAPNELSLYVGEDYRNAPIKLSRFAVRLDGFFSWRCDYKPGRVVTKPIVFNGNNLTINFATSAIGYVQIRILDAEGIPIEGYDSARLFGDSVDRTVDFEKKLADLAGKAVRLEISMSDADLYSFKFEEIPAII